MHRRTCFSVVGLVALTLQSLQLDINLTIVHFLIKNTVLSTKYQHVLF